MDPEVTPQTLCGWCSQPVQVNALKTARDLGEDVALFSEITVASFARRGDGVVWHPDCFVKHLAHTDEIKGIKR